MGSGRYWGAAAGAVLGAIGGYYLGGTSGAFQGAMVGSSIGMVAGSAIDPPAGRLGDAQYAKQDVYYNTVAHNIPVPVVYGINRVAGNLIWFGNVNVQVTTSEGGGKEGGSGGGSKGGSSGTQEATVYADFAVALSEGEIQALTELFIGDKRITEVGGLTYTVYLGTPTQTADSRIQTDLGALAPAFRHTAYVAIGGALGNYPSVPNVNAEIIGRFATDLPSSFMLISSYSPPTMTWSGYLGIYQNLPASPQGTLYYASDNTVAVGPYADYNGYIWLSLSSLVGKEGYPLPQNVYIGLATIGSNITSSNIFELNQNDINLGYIFAYNGPNDFSVDTPTLTVLTVNSGMSGRLFLPDNTIVATAYESQRTLTFVIDPTVYTMPLSGYIELYSDGLGFSTLAENGRWPTDDDTYATIQKFGYFERERHYTWGNPSTIVRDILTDGRYGVGIDESRIDSASFAEVYSYCCEEVPYLTVTGSIAYEPRFCLDYVADAQSQVVDHLRAMLATCGGFLTWSQSVMKLHIDKPGETVIQSFGMNEIVEKSFQWKKHGYRDRPNVVRIEYIEPGALTPDGSDARAADSNASFNPSTMAQYWGTNWQLQQGTVSGNVSYSKVEYKVYRQDFVEASDIWDIDRTGERREKIYNLTGIKRRSQAQRMAYYYLNKAIFCQHACSFRVGINALKAEVGDVIAVSHDIPRWAGKLFRIAEIQENENDELIIGCLEYNEAVYSDSFAQTPHGQNTLYGDNGGVGGMPVNLSRVSVYERPYEETVEIAYTRIATRDFFSGSDIYVDRGGLGNWVPIAESIITNAPTAYLTSEVNSLVLTTIGIDSSKAITIRGVPDGYSARYCGYAFQQNSGPILASEIATMGTVVLSPPALGPSSGYIQLYTDGTSYITRAAAGRYPVTNFTSFQGQDIFDYKRIPQVMTATQTWAYIDRPLGGWTNGESLRIENEEISYITFTDSMLTGLQRGVNGTTAAQHTGVLSLWMVTTDSGGGDPLSNFTNIFTDPTTAMPFFAQNSRWTYIGANSKFSAINIWLARVASEPLALAGEYSTGQGSWGNLANSWFIPTVDTTSGFRWHGQIQIEPPGDWAITNEVTDGGLNISDTTSRYYIRLMRVASLCQYPPQILEMTLTSDVLAVVRKSGAFLYEYTLQDSGQLLTFKAIPRSIGGLAGDSISAGRSTYNNDAL